MKQGIIKFGGQGRNEPPTKGCFILPLDYFQLRFNFLCEAAQSLK